jgi:hypothetical protein
MKKLWSSIWQGCHSINCSMIREGDIDIGIQSVYVSLPDLSPSQAAQLLSGTNIGPRLYKETSHYVSSSII